MKHTNGREIFGVSFADIADGSRSRCNVTACLGDYGIVLRASGAQYGAPLRPDDLDQDSRAAYDLWLLLHTPPAAGS